MVSTVVGATAGSAGCARALATSSMTRLKTQAGMRMRRSPAAAATRRTRALGKEATPMSLSVAVIIAVRMRVKSMMMRGTLVRRMANNRVFTTHAQASVFFTMISNIKHN